MKILFVFDFSFTDYMADSIFHGLVDAGHEVYNTHYPGYMLTSYDNLSGLYGRGFSLYGKLDYTPTVEDHQVTLEKIKDKFYDCVIYPCVYSNWWVEQFIPKRASLYFIEDVIKYYPKHKVHFVDGADDTKNYILDFGFADYGIVWKRELTSYEYGNPISFAIPESQLIQKEPLKEYLFSSKINPPSSGENSDPSKYTFNDEKEYYHEYAKSFYGYTCKKSGWDCYRHYEILANKTIPAFHDLENCPATILTNFPKNIIMEVNKYSLNGEIHPKYFAINEYLFNYTKKYLTTKKMVERFL